MEIKPLIIIVAGIVGIVLVGLYPRWVYFNQTLVSEEINLGYRHITEPHAAPSIIKIENGRKIHYQVKGAEPQIDRQELSSRIGLIVIAVFCGLWGLRAHSRYNQKRENLKRTSIDGSEKSTPNNTVQRSARSEFLIVP